MTLYIDNRASLTDDSSIASTDWELYIQEISLSILSEQTPGRLLQIRGQLYDLLSHCIPGDLILKHLTFSLLKTMDQEIMGKIIEAAAEYDHRLRLGNKDIFHLEAFVAKAMSIYKRYLMDLGVA